jgi:hypothetical protein
MKERRSRNRQKQKKEARRSRGNEERWGRSIDDP